MNAAIIVAAGRGTRMGPGVDKLFLEACGRPVVAHTWARFDSIQEIDEIVLAIRTEMREAFERLASQFRMCRPFKFVSGGEERQDSVWNAIQALTPGVEVVAIQDGARPCTAPGLVIETLDVARRTGAAVAASRVTDTIKESDGNLTIARNLDRSRLWSVQTPQSFRVDIIRRGLEAVRRRGLRVTDDTAACEVIGQPVALVESILPNPKVTVPADLPYIESLLRQQDGDHRVEG